MKLTRRIKINIGITAIVLAVILVGFGLYKIGTQRQVQPNSNDDTNIFIFDPTVRHPLSGKPLENDFDEFFIVSVMIENAADVLPQSGLDQADIVYEALVEGNITRLLAVFDSNAITDKVGPVRSARNYFLDWAEEYGGMYMHVGGSPQALRVIDKYDFLNIDEISANGIYFWRDTSLRAPSNVFTSSANWLRAGEFKDIETMKPADLQGFKYWDFAEKIDETTDIVNKLTIDFSSDLYEVDWSWNDSKQAYVRYQGGDRYNYRTGEQAFADNVVVQFVESRLIDVERLGMDTKDGGKAIIYNKYGKQEGTWLYLDGRTIFLNKNQQPMTLVPGKTWVEIVNNEEDLIE